MCSLRSERQSKSPNLGEMKQNGNRIPTDQFVKRVLTKLLIHASFVCIFSILSPFTSYCINCLNPSMSLYKNIMKSEYCFEYGKPIITNCSIYKYPCNLLLDRTSKVSKCFLYFIPNTLTLRMLLYSSANIYLANLACLINFRINFNLYLLGFILSH